MHHPPHLQASQQQQQQPQQPQQQYLAQQGPGQPPSALRGPGGAQQHLGGGVPVGMVSSHLTGHGHGGGVPISVPHSRLAELLDSVRMEADVLLNDLAQCTHRHDDLETKYKNQVNELAAYQQHLYDLERTHGTLKKQYEEEIQRLHKELDAARGGSGNAPPIAPAVDRLGYKSGVAPNYPENVPPPTLASGDNGNSVFGALMGGGSGGGNTNGGGGGGNVNLPEHRGSIDGHPSKRIRAEDSLHPSQQQHMMGHQTQQQQSQMAPQSGYKGGPPLRQDQLGYGHNPTHSPADVGNDMKRKIPPLGMPDQYRPPQHMQGKPQYPPQQLGYPGPPPSQQQQQPVYPPPMQHQQMHPQYQQQPPPQAQQPQQLAIPRGVETGICDLDGILSSTNPALAQWKKQGPDWTVVYNPKSISGKNKVDVSLAHSLDHGSVVCCVKFSNDGAYLATGCNRTAQVFDARTGTRLHTLTVTTDGGNQPVTNDLYIRSVCFSPDSKSLATGAEDKIIRIWDVGTRTLKCSLRGHEQDIYSMDWSKDGMLLVTGSGDRSVRVWDASANEGSTGKCLMALFNEEEPVRDSMGQTPKDSGVTSVAISPADGRCVAAASLDMKVRIWDLRTGRLLERFEGHKDSVYSVAFSQDGRSIVSASLDKTLKVWDLSHQTLATLSRPAELGILPHANPASAHPSPPAVIVTTRCRHTYGGHKNYVLSVAYPGLNAPFATVDGARTGLEEIEWVVSASKDRNVTFWDAKAGAGAAGGGDLTSCAQFMLQGHKNSVISIAMSASEGLFATGSGDLRARIWKITPLQAKS